MYDKVSELRNEFLEIQFDEYINFSLAIKQKGWTLNIILLIIYIILLDTHDYCDWFEKEESTDTAPKIDQKK